MDAVVRYTIGQPGNEQVRSVNALVGETNDGGLNDIRGLHVTREHVLAAIREREGRRGRRRHRRRRHRHDLLRTGRAASAPRRGSFPPTAASYTVGVLAQTNFGGNLTHRRRADLPVAAAAPHAQPRPRQRQWRRLAACSSSPPTRRSTPAICGRLAARAVFGLARTGSSLQQRQRRLRDRLLHVARDAQPLQRDRRRARARSCRPTRRRRCSRRRSRRRRRRSTTRCSRRRRCARRTAPPRRFRFDRVRDAA